MNKQTSKKTRLVIGKVCPQCHYLVPYHNHYCYYCGLNFKQHARCAAVDAGNSFPTHKKNQICPRCHHKISFMDHYCSFCGIHLKF